MKRLSILFAGAVFAAAAFGQAAAPLSSGEVKKVDKEAAKITIKHGPLANLNMPAMTMVFKVGERAMLDRVAAGDKIGFTAEMVGGALTVIKLQSANQ